MIDGILPRQRGSRASKPSVLAVIGLGYLLILISTLTFMAILCVNSIPSVPEFDVKPIDGRTWTDWEREYAETSTEVGVMVEADYRVDMAYNFSILPIQVRVTNLENVTIPSFEVSVLVEDNTGHIRGFGGVSPKLSATDERVVKKILLYNVPAILRGQELRIHVIAFIQQTLAVDKDVLVVRTFPMLEIKELPRILLFFLTFSTLPVSVFLPAALRKWAEDWWRRRLQENALAVPLLIIFSVIGLAVYWNWVCKVFSFL